MLAPLCVGTTGWLQLFLQVPFQLHVMFGKMRYLGSKAGEFVLVIHVAVVPLKPCTRMFVMEYHWRLQQVVNDLVCQETSSVIGCIKECIVNLPHLRTRPQFPLRDMGH